MATPKEALAFLQELPDCHVELSYQQLSTFELFPKLPTEIRCLIWAACFPPPRRVPIDTGPINIPGCFCLRPYAPLRYSVPPPITHAICRESRVETFLAYELHWCGNVASTERRDYKTIENEMPLWFSPEKDTATIALATMHTSSLQWYRFAEAFLDEIRAPSTLLNKIIKLEIERTGTLSKQWSISPTYAKSDIGALVSVFGRLKEIYFAGSNKDARREVGPTKDERWLNKRWLNRAIDRCVGDITACFEKVDGIDNAYTPPKIWAVREVEDN